MNKTVHYLGLDVHKETIAVAIAPGDSSENIELRFIYEAGPCGYVIHRHLKSKGHHCDVVSPSLIPKKASDRVKTDRRDAEQLAQLYRAQDVAELWHPAEQHMPAEVWGAGIGRRSLRK